MSKLTPQTEFAGPLSLLPTRPRPQSRGQLSLNPKLTLSVVLILLIVFFTASQPNFLTFDNFLNIARLQAVPLILAVGMTMVVLTGGADLSVGSALALSGVIAGLLYVNGVPAPAVILLAVLCGILLGLLNGLLIGALGMSFFVVTLGTLAGYRSLALVASDGTSIQLGEAPLLLTIGDGSIGVLPIPVLLAALVTVFGHLALSGTGWGRKIYAVGSNREAARLAGIRVNRVLVSVYVTSGLLAGLASVIQIGRLTTASPVVGTGIELQVIAAVLLGGTILSGGSGGLGGTVLAVLMLGVLQNGLTLSGTPDFWQGAITGAILIVAVFLDHLQRRRRGLAEN